MAHGVAHRGDGPVATGGHNAVERSGVGHEVFEPRSRRGEAHHHFGAARAQRSGVVVEPGVAAARAGVDYDQYPHVRSNRLRATPRHDGSGRLPFLQGRYPCAAVQGTGMRRRQ